MKLVFNIILFLFFSFYSYGQSLPSFHFIDEDLEEYSMSFIEINNLVLLPVVLNKSDTLFFILDSGAENITLFSSGFIQTPLDTNYLRKVKVIGAGKNAAIDAFVSPLNTLQVGRIIGDNQNIVYIPDDEVKFSDLLGHPVHGILGVPIFKHFSVKLDYQKKKVTFYGNDSYKPHRRFSTTDLTIIGHRPFIELNMEIQPRINLFTTLLLDSGESKPLSIFLNSDEKIFIPYPNYYTNLGKGINGLVTGRIAKISSINVDDYVLKNVITSFPDEENIIHVTDLEERNGSIGAGFLKKFTSVIDLKNEKLYLRRNKFFRMPFKYDKTGVAIVAEGKKYNQFIISGLIAQSPGEKSGLKIGDRLIRVDGIDLSDKKIGEVIQLIDEAGKRIVFEIERNGEIQDIKVRTYRL